MIIATKCKKYVYAFARLKGLFRDLILVFDIFLDVLFVLKYAFSEFAITLDPSIRVK